ncbi:MAG TPA: glycosyltransferase family 87 protein [Urbifossiella sp.]|nr:glycosyltransferase family 87 protein [Urbifossiella sp.]
MGEESGYLIPRRYWIWAADPVFLRGLAWLAVGIIAIGRYQTARSWLKNTPDMPDEVRRPVEGPNGHTQIDFGGQWVMGRMVVLGHGQQLYHRQVQWGVVRTGFPVAEESRARKEETLLPAHLRQFARNQEDVGHDADNLMYWFMGADPKEWTTVGRATAAPLAVDLTGNPLASLALSRASLDAVTPAIVKAVSAPAIGGPLYPPVHALLYVPIGLFDSPRRAYHVFQVVAIGFAFLAGAGLSALSRWRVWWSACTAGVLLFPGCGPALELGQNPTVSLSIAVWGWVLASRGRDLTGGVVWGLFAFKPVWALAFFLVPLLQRRWRFLAGMVGTGVALGVVTFPVVGVHSWFDWLKVGREAAALYNVHEPWISLSRDLQGIPRRFLYDFGIREEDRETPFTRLVVWVFWAGVFVPTVLIGLARANRRPVGIGAAFLFFGAFLTCYRFMYYDLLLALMGFAVLVAEPGRILRTRIFPLRLIPSPALPSVGLPADPPPADPTGPRAVGYLNSFPLTVLLLLFIWENVLISMDVRTRLEVFGWFREKPDGSQGPATLHLDTSLAYACDTGLVLLAWAWCGARLLLRAEPGEKTACPELPTGALPPLK